jgi:hypothetical protein
MLKQAPCPAVGFVVGFRVGIEKVGEILIGLPPETVKVFKTLTVSHFCSLPDPDQQMKMVGHQYPGIGIRNGREVLVVKVQKITVVASFPK